MAAFGAEDSGVGPHTSLRFTALKEGRKFVRHAVKVPIEVSTIATARGSAREGVNLSFGGLAFLVDDPLLIGQTVALRMPTVKPPFVANARVAWCRPEGTRHCVGVEFTNSDDASQSRMVQQVCAVETYRLEQMKKGRRLTPAEAAEEWNRKNPSN